LPSSASTATQTLSVTEVQLGPKSFAYQGVGSVTGGTVKISFTNAGKQNAPDELQLARIDSGHSATDVKTAMVKLLTGNGHVPTPTWLHPASGVGPTAPNQTATAVVKLPAGQYYAFDTQSPPGPGNSPPFLTEGAFTSLQVTGGAASALPTTAGKVTIKDQPHDKFAFAVSGLKSGPDVITFDNKSKEAHHVLAVRLLPGHTPAQALAVFVSQGPPKGQPPVDFNSINGAAVADNKTTQVNTITFAQPGKYILFCFLSDKDGKGKPHLQRGLFKEVTVS
jgi:plastocyanin